MNNLNNYILERFLLSTYCDAVLGCFPTDGVFSERIVNLNPNSRATVNTRFEVIIISTAANKTQSCIFNLESGMKVQSFFASI